MANAKHIREMNVCSLTSWMMGLWWMVATRTLLCYLSIGVRPKSIQTSGSMWRPLSSAATFAPEMEITGMSESQKTNQQMYHCRLKDRNPNTFKQNKCRILHEFDSPICFISFHFIYCRVRHRWTYNITQGISRLKCCPNCIRLAACWSADRRAGPTLGRSITPGWRGNRG